MPQASMWEGPETVAGPSEKRLGIPSWMHAPCGQPGTVRQLCYAGVGETLRDPERAA